MLPTLPQAGAPIGIDDVQRIEASIAREVMAISDLDTLMEWRAKAAALEAYFQSKDLSGPMLGAQRRVEARIGQLLGKTELGERHDLKPSLAGEGSIPRQDRNRFRQLARAFEVLTEDAQWRRSRLSLIAYLREVAPVPKRQPEVIVQANGTVKKQRGQRIAEISRLAAAGYRAAQIAEELGIGETHIRNIARDEGIRLPDQAIGRTRKLDARRIIEQTISGVAAHVSGAELAGDLSEMDFQPEEIAQWVELLSDSIRSLRRLQNTLERMLHDRSIKATA